jgi:hypothetical protein
MTQLIAQTERPGASPGPSVCGEIGGGYSVQRLKTREPLVPPKPKEFERA